MHGVPTPRALMAWDVVAAPPSRPCGLPTVREPFQQSDSCFRASGALWQRCGCWEASQNLGCATKMSNGSVLQFSTLEELSRNADPSALAASLVGILPSLKSIGSTIRPAATINQFNAGVESALLEALQTTSTLMGEKHCNRTVLGTSELAGSPIRGTARAVGCLFVLGSARKDPSQSSVGGSSTQLQCWNKNHLPILCLKRVVNSNAFSMPMEEPIVV